MLTPKRTGQYLSEGENKYNNTIKFIEVFKSISP